VRCSQATEMANVAWRYRACERTETCRWPIDCYRPRQNRLISFERHKYRQIGCVCCHFRRVDLPSSSFNSQHAGRSISFAGPIAKDTRSAPFLPCARLRANVFHRVQGTLRYAFNTRQASVPNSLKCQRLRSSTLHIFFFQRSPFIHSHR
jgi:hypothetical protein